MTVQKKLGILYAWTECTKCTNCLASRYCGQGNQAKLNFIREIQEDVNSILEQLPKAKEET